MDKVLQDSIGHFFSTDDFGIRPLNLDDVEDIQDLLLESIDYYKMTKGIEPRQNEAEKIVNFRHEGMGKRFLLGAFTRQKELFAVIDFYELIDSELDWEIDTFLLSPDFRNQGYGKKLYEKVSSYIKENDGRTVFVKISTHNDYATSFLLSLGFSLHYTGVEKNLGGEAALYMTMKHILRRSLYLKS